MHSKHELLRETVEQCRTDDGRRLQSMFEYIDRTKSVDHVNAEDMAEGEGDDNDEVLNVWSTPYSEIPLFHQMMYRMRKAGSVSSNK